MSEIQERVNAGIKWMSMYIIIRAGCQSLGVLVQNTSLGSGPHGEQNAGDKFPA